MSSNKSISIITSAISILSVGILTGCENGFLVDQNALFPKVKTPESLAYFLNNEAKWDNPAAKLNFTNLYNCTDYPNSNYYSCSGGYVEINDPLGKKVCALTAAWATYDKQQYRYQYGFDCQRKG